MALGKKPASKKKKRDKMKRDNPRDKKRGGRVSRQRYSQTCSKCYSCKQCKCVCPKIKL